MDDISPWSLFGTELRRLREARGLSESELARAIPLSHASISRWEHGHRPVPADQARRLDNALGADGHLVALQVMASAAAEPRRTVEQNASSPTDEDSVERRAAMRLLTALSAGSVAPLDALNLVTSKAEGSAGSATGLNVDEWKWILYEHVHRYRAAKPGALLSDLTADFVEISRLLRASTSVPRAELAGIGAQLAVLMASDFGDVGQPYASRRLFATAYQLAGASGDRDLLVWVRAIEAKNAFYDDRPVPVVMRLADEAIGVAGGAPSAGLALAYGVRARVLARQGHGADARTMLTALNTVCKHRPTSDDPPAWRWEGGGLNTTESHVYALLGDSRASAAIDQSYQLLSVNAYGPMANLAMIQALHMVRQGYVNDGVDYAAQTMAGRPLSAQRRMVTGQILAALPDKAKELPAARELGALTA